MNIDEILQLPPYALAGDEKQRLLLSAMRDLTVHHYQRCEAYRRILDAFRIDPTDIESSAHAPYLPVRLFKEFELISVPENEIVKTLTSSGTSGQQVSRIFLNRETAANQTKALARIVNSFIGQSRSPMVIIDSESAINGRGNMSARTAGVLGFSMFGREKIFALDEHMEPNVSRIKDFLERHEDEIILVFGFTFIVWKYFLEYFARSNSKLDLSRAVLIHGGGWKKMQEQSVAPTVFKAAMREVFGLCRVHDYYGMAEQTGSIHMECEQGYLHTSIYGDVITRRAVDFSEASVGEKGIIQVLSVLPGSYPGHALLTEDEGIIWGEDDCPCGRHGKYFQVTGRLKNAEMRGCSDTHESRNY